MESLGKLDSRSVNSVISQESRENLERAKIDLTNKPEFNLIDAFRIFSFDGQDMISAK